MSKWFYGYKLKNGEIKARIYFGDDDLVECEESPFVERTFGPFSADDIDDAKKIVEKCFSLN
jgi:hypothetical protein